MRSIKLKKLEGFSLVELIVAITIFFMISASVIVFSVDSLRASANNRTELKGNLFLQESFNAILVTKNENWIDIVINTNDGDKHMELIDNQYQILDGTMERDGVTVGFVINEVYRDASENIVTSGGTLDPLTREIMLTAEWVDILGQAQSVSFVSYVNSWKIERWHMDTQAEFDTGTYDLTDSTSTDDGEVELDKVFFPDWCNPELTISEYDIRNQAKAKTIFATLGHAFLGTGGNSSGTTLTKLNITGVNPPIVNEEGVFDGEKVNDIFVSEDGNTAYMASDNNSKEVIILDVSSEPYTVIGSFDAPGSTNAESVFVDGNVGYVGQGRRMRTFDLTSNYGSRPELDNVTLGWWWASIEKIYVADGFAYSVMYNDWFELTIVDASNPSNLSITSQTSVNNQQVLDMYISEDTTRAYFGTNYSNYEDEFFIVDSTSKYGTLPVISSYNTDNTITGVAVVEEDNVAIVTAEDGEEYKVLQIENETNPIYCGGLEVNEGVYDLDSIADGFGNVFSYIMTGEAGAELKIILGGPGGGGEDGYAYSSSGTYESPVFDSESTFTNYLFMSWTENLQVTTDLEIQVRTGTTSDLSGETYVGPDGTSGTVFSTNSGEIFPDSLNNKQYIQFKADFTSANPEFTSILEDISIIYQN